MFGTLVTNVVGRGGLEFIKNPDPADAINRNIRNNPHVSCMFCRSRKVRCSGGRPPCQRCSSMGIDCVFPSQHGRGAGSRRGRGHVPTPSASGQSTLPSSLDCDTEASAAPRATSTALPAASTATLSDLSNLVFDNDDSLMPWMSASGSPMSGQHERFDFDRAPSASACGSDSSSLDLGTSLTGLPSSRKPSAPSLTADNLSTLLDMDSLDSWESELLGPSQTLLADSKMVIDSPSRTKVARLDTNAESGSPSGCCLLGAIAFLERLGTRTATAVAHEANRIDTLLADLRNAIETLSALVACERCAGRVELSMLLSIIVRQISLLCKRTITAYQSLVHATERASSPSSPERLSSPLQHHQQELDALVPISVSTYRANPRERLHMLRSLLMLQTSEFQVLVQTIESRQTAPLT